MYTDEQKQRAVELYERSLCNEREVIRKLGYPSPNTLRNWYKEYKEKGDWSRKPYKRRYTEEQICTAVQYVEEHGNNLTQACRALGYPCGKVLRAWIQERKPELLKRDYPCKSKRSAVEYDIEMRKAAVQEFAVERIPIYKVAAKYGVSRASISNWTKQMLGANIMFKDPGRKKSGVTAPSPNRVSETDVTEATKLELEAQVAELQKELHQLRMETDALKKAAEILKKLRGIDLKRMRNPEKADVIDALRNVYQLNELLSLFGISKSSYFYCRKAKMSTDKYQAVRLKIRAIFERNSCCYGYRRIHAMIKREGNCLSEKVVRRIMREEHLIVKALRRKKYNSYKGEITPAVPNLIMRDFHAEAPNQKWLTDITEFALPAGKVYLSPIIDCFDGMPVSWTIGTSPNAELANTMLQKAIETLQPEEHPILHSDRGCHYRWPDWIKITEAAGLIRSMSKKGCSPDNSACEGFFGRLKNEMFYERRWDNVSLKEFIAILDKYIRWYATERIKASIGWQTLFSTDRLSGLCLEKRKSRAFATGLPKAPTPLCFSSVVKARVVFSGIRIAGKSPPLKP